MRRYPLCILMTLAIAAVQAGWCAGTTSGKPSIVLVDNGQPLAEIVVPAKGLQEGEAVYPPLDYAKTPQVLAEMLVEYIRKSTGGRLPITQESARTPGRVAVHCGNTEYVNKLGLKLEGMDEDEFLIAFPDSKTIVIAANYQHGVEWGVCEFLERYVGVRWLFAGPLAEHVPERKALAVPAVEVQSRPAYLTRAIAFDNDRQELTVWSRFNRLRRRNKHDHNLGVLFPFVRYKDSHPEFYPVQHGQRLQPSASLMGWQPCFTAPGLVEEAVRNITDYFRAHPEKRSYPLSVNDGGGHCECPACLARDGNRTNYFGLRDRSNSYYDFCNRVAEGVTKTFPDKQFGLYAYCEVGEPPAGMEINEHLVPYLTQDRMKWLDKKIEGRGHEITRRWAERCKEIGWYDYTSGRWYLVPRVYFHKMAEYLRSGHANKVRHYYAEAYTADDYREGPKEYLTMKLLWNPSLDVDATLKEWYECAVGPKAAPCLGQYFAYWESFWTKRIPQGEWFKASGDSLMLDYGDLRYCNDLREEDFVKCEKLLEKTLDATTTEVQHKRARLLLDGLRKAKTVALLHIHFAELNRKLGNATDVRQVNASGFDQDAEVWGNWKNDYSHARFSWDGSIGHAAPGAMLIDRTDDQRVALVGGAVFLKSFPVTRGKTERISTWVRTENVRPGAQVWVQAAYQDKASTWIDLMYMTHKMPLRAIEPGQWQKIEMLCQVPEDPRVCYLTVLLAADKTNTGKVWFDDFALSEVELGR